MAKRELGVFLVVAVGLSAVPNLSAQVRQIAGQVTNTQTGAGVAEATIAVQGTKIVAQSSGRWAILAQCAIR